MKNVWPVLKWILLGIWIFLLIALIFTILIIDDHCESLSIVSDSDIQTANQQYNANKKEADIVISFTTLPNRLQSKSFRKCVIAMLEQSVRPREIRINIPYRLKRTGQEYIVPEWLIGLNPNVIIVRCEDMGPATKYIPTLQNFRNQPNQRIVIYDDDSIMPRDFIENSDKNSRKYPNYCFATTSYRFSAGEPHFHRTNLSSSLTLFRRISFWLSGYREQDLKDRNEEYVLTDTVMGWTGYLLTPNMLDLTDVTDFDNLPKAAFFVDDVVISAALAKHGTQIAIGPNLHYPKMTLDNFTLLVWNAVTSIPNESLSSKENKGLSNDDIMEHYYASYWHFF